MKAQDLKNSILQYAIQGKLVAQDENDEPAEVLYAKIQAEKQKLIKEGKIKKDKPLPPITEDEIPFPIPPTWKWVRLGEIFNIVLGQSPKGESVGLKKGVEFHQGKVFFGERYLQLSGQYTNQPQKIVSANTVLLCVRAPVGVLNITERQICIGRGLAGISSIYAIDSNFIYFFLQGLKKYFIEKSTGTTFPAITGKIVEEQILPLPPLEEQKRIVAKIEELEPLINQYDQAEQELSTLNNKFPEQLKKSILQYAIQGKLVAQDENDEPAEVLYAKIQAEKQKLIKEGKIKKDKHLPPITEDEIPFPIPPTWKWVQLGEIVNTLTAGGDKPKVFSKHKTEHNIFPVIANGKINQGILGYTDKPVITEQSITVSGRGTMGFVCVREPNFVPIVRLLVLQTNIHTDIYYLKYAIEALIGEGTGSAVQQLTVPMLKPLLIPLPPLEEQHRIIAKVESLLEWCEKLK